MMRQKPLSSRVLGLGKLKKRADERTRTADLISLRVIIRVLQGFAESANPHAESIFRSLHCPLSRGIAPELGSSTLGIRGARKFRYCF
jgi:hypothetical protein